MVNEARPAGTLGTRLLALAGSWLIASGLAAWYFASSGLLLPHDVQFLGITGPELCQIDSCRILAFMIHDRVSFGGAVMAVGFLYVWLARWPLARGEAWAFWTLALSGLVGFGSFLSYLQFGYLDLLHLWATLVELGLFSLGLGLAWRTLPEKLGPVPAFREVSARRESFGMGQALLAFVAGGIVLAGFVIWTLGATRVFVPTDFEFLKLRLFELRALSPRLVPLIAHDRSGFGGALCSTGAAILPIALYGLRRGAEALWWALLTAGVAGFGAAIGIHFVVGYTVATHLLPAIAGGVSFAVAILLLYRPLNGPARGPNLV
jgi:hypothetical protein